MSFEPQRRVAITGIGIVSPLGNDANVTWQALLEKKSGVEQISSFDASGFPTRIAAEVKNFDPGFIKQDRQLKRFTVPLTQYALSAAEQAFIDADIRPKSTTAERWGAVVGSGMMTAQFDYWQRFQSQFALDGEVDMQKVCTQWQAFYSTRDFGKTKSNGGLALLLQRYQIEGYATSVHTACASGGQALGLALRAVRRGDADYMLVGGFDSMINPVGLSSFCLLGALSTYNETPTTASRPFDLTRNGFVLGEGAAFLIFEDLELARKRGARIYAEVAGEGNSLSSYRITDSHPGGDGAIQCIKNALAHANESIDRVDYINTHGTSTKMNDLAETNAIKNVFGDYALSIPCSSTKSQTGHLIAGAGALEGAFTALSIHYGQMPMTANRTSPDPECDLDFIVEGPRNKKIRVALSNSFGFGGSNSCLVFRDPELEGGK